MPHVLALEIALAHLVPSRPAVETAPTPMEVKAVMITAIVLAANAAQHTVRCFSAPLPSAAQAAATASMRPADEICAVCVRVALAERRWREAPPEYDTVLYPHHGPLVRSIDALDCATIPYHTVLVLIQINRPARHRAQRQGRGEAVDNLDASCKSTTGPTHTHTKSAQIHPPDRPTD